MGKMFRDVSELTIQDGYSTASAIALMLFFARMTDLRRSPKCCFLSHLQWVVFSFF